MKHKPVKDAKEGRGDFFYTLKDDITRIWFGNPGDKDAGAEFVLQAHIDHIPSLIATLRLIQERKDDEQK